MDWQTGLAPDRDALASAWHQIDIRLALDRHWINVELAFDWQNLHWIDIRLELDWRSIGPCLTSERRRIGNGLARLASDWGQIGDGLKLD